MPRKIKVEITDLSKDPGSILVTMAVEDGVLLGMEPAPGSIMMPCARCKRDCWVGKASQQTIVYISEISCVRCADERGWLEGDPTIYTTKEVLQEVKERYGEDS